VEKLITCSLTTMIHSPTLNKFYLTQRRAARYVVSNQRNRSSVSNMLQRLKWRPLANRRKDARLMMMYNIIIHVGTAWRLKGHNLGLKSFSCVQLHKCLVAADSNPSLFLGKRTSFWCQYDRILVEMPCCVYVATKHCGAGHTCSL
jgi:hypothetical protein